MFSLDFSSLLIADNLTASTSSKLQYENPRDKEQRVLKSEYPLFGRYLALKKKLGIPKLKMTQMDE